MEVFAQQTIMHTVLRNGQHINKKVFVPPKVLARANASCIHAACHKVPGFALAEIKQLCSRSERSKFWLKLSQGGAGIGWTPAAE